MSDIDVGVGLQVAYQNDVGGIKALPQLSAMKQASADQTPIECSPPARG